MRRWLGPFVWEFPTPPCRHLLCPMERSSSLSPSFAVWDFRAAQLVVAGDRDLGKQLFFGKGRCSGCHMIRGQGGLLGPDLSNVGAIARLRKSSSPY